MAALGLLGREATARILINVQLDRNNGLAVATLLVDNEDAPLCARLVYLSYLLWPRLTGTSNSVGPSFLGHSSSGLGRGRLLMIHAGDFFLWGTANSVGLCPHNNKKIGRCFRTHRKQARNSLFCLMNNGRNGRATGKEDSRSGAYSSHANLENFLQRLSYDVPIRRACEFHT